MLRRVGVAISAGRRAYLLKERIHNREELIEAIQAVAHGGPVIDPMIVDVLIQARLRAANSQLSKLTAHDGPKRIEVGIPYGRVLCQSAAIRSSEYATRVGTSVDTYRRAASTKRRST